MDPAPSHTWPAAAQLVERICAGDTSAWPALLELIEPRLRVWVRYQKIGRLRRREDDLHNIVVEVLDKLSRDDFRVLRGYAAMSGQPSFQGWLRRVLRSCAIDYLRRHPEYRRSGRPPVSGDGASGDGSPGDGSPGDGSGVSEGRWFTLQTLTTGIAQNPMDSVVDKRRQVRAALAQHIAEARALQSKNPDAIAILAERWRVDTRHVKRLLERGERMQQVIELLFTGYRHNDIADQLGLSRREVELALKYVEEFLSARWRDVEER